MARPESKLNSLKDRQNRYLQAVERLGTVSAGTKSARCSRGTVYAWREVDQEGGYSAQEFVALEKAAFQNFYDNLENEAARRAYRGIRKGVWYQGKRVGYEREFSDGLLQFLLAGGRPEKFKQRVANEHSAPGGGPIQHEHVHRFAGMTDEELEAFIRDEQSANEPVPEGSG